MWRSMHHLFGLGVGYLEDHENHGNKGTEIIYLGPRPRNGALEVHAHYGLCIADKTIRQFRTVRTQAIYPWVPTVQYSLSPPAPDTATLESTPLGGDKEDERGTPTDTGDTGPLPDVAEGIAQPRAPTKFTPKELEKYPPGTQVMTTSGPCQVVKRYDDGDYAVQWVNSAEPQEVWSVRPHQLWTLDEYPDWVYDHKGQRVTHQAPGKEPTARISRLDIGSKSEATAPDVEAMEVKADVPDGPAGRTRSRAKGHMACAGYGEQLTAAQSYRVWDPGGEVQVLHHPNDEITLAILAKKVKTKPIEPVPEGLPLTLTEEELQTMQGCDVERFLPRHFHQTHGHPLRMACARGEVAELQDCLNRSVWGNPTEITDNHIVIGLMWVYAIKIVQETGAYKKVRSRITLMGNQERTLLGRMDAFAPVAQMVTGRLLIAMHLHIKDIIIRQLDVKNAYINEYMRRLVYCHLPPGYTIQWLPGGAWTFRRLRKGEKAPRLCLPLIKALYGGMECGRIFWEAWVDWHLSQGFQIIHEERCYLCRRSSNGSYIKLGYHVDDNMVIALGAEYYADYLTSLNVKFDVEEGPLREHLGVLYDLDLENGICRMSQPSQALKVLKLFGMEHCKPHDTPCADGPLPCAMDAEEQYEEEFDMQEFVGHITWLVLCCRPDMAQILKVLSRFTKPGSFGKRHVHFAKHLLRYLRGTTQLGLTYRAGFPQFFQFFTDASHASCVDTRRSIVSLVVKYGGNTVYWKTSFTSIVSHSSTESELMALDVGATASQAFAWLCQAMGGAIQGRQPIFVDNTSTIVIATNPVQPGRNLHVHARYFYVRDLVYDDHLVVCYLPTEDQVADVGCTFKGGPSFLRLRSLLMNCARVVRDLNEGELPRWEVMGEGQ